MRIFRDIAHRRCSRFLYAALVMIFASFVAGCNEQRSNLLLDEPQFDGKNAFEFVAYQQKLGPRTPGSEGHKKIIAWIDQNLQDYGCEVEYHNVKDAPFEITNIIGQKGVGEVPFVIIGAHYDTRLYADQEEDESRKLKPVPGANDGASGVAVLLELARIIPNDYPGKVWFVFFDAEDDGDIDNYSWCMGSNAFVKEYFTRTQNKPDAVIIIDMIGDADLNIYYEKNSNNSIREEIWQIADELGYSQYFIKREKYQMVDDHVPFLQKGIPAVDIIDFDYPYWHTQEDTLDKISPNSLEIVGHTIEKYLSDLVATPTDD